MIQYSIVPSGIAGQLLVAVGERGICAVLPGDHSGSMIRELQQRFPDHVLGFVPPSELEDAQQVAHAVAGKVDVSSLRLDFQGTEFQRQVWQQLMRIPRGRTISYSELAERIGQPTAVRAVASACAANPLALLVPCHRVVAKSGQLSGYRWGLERKQMLLQHEQKRFRHGPMKVQVLAR